MDLHFDCRANLDSYQLITAGSKAAQSFRLVTINVLHSRPENCASHTPVIFWLFTCNYSQLIFKLSQVEYNVSIWAGVSIFDHHGAVTQNQSNQIFLTYPILIVPSFVFSAVSLLSPHSCRELAPLKPAIATRRAKPV